MKDVSFKVTVLILFVGAVCLGSYFAAALKEAELASANLDLQSTSSHIAQLRSNAKLRVLKAQLAGKQQELDALAKELASTKKALEDAGRRLAGMPVYQQ
ncbi:MAG: hypothetical protein HQL16_03640 [Candidatus Omnitrophica bacterium]|nr:hypothetical protein [Candidatus Omnitrophota bacterium]